MSKNKEDKVIQLLAMISNTMGFFSHPYMEALVEIAKEKPDERIIPGLIAIVESCPNYAARCLALDALGQIGNDARIIPLFLDVMKNETDFTVRRFAFSSLMKFEESFVRKNKQVIPVLEEIIYNETDFGVRTLALRAYRKFAKAEQAVKVFTKIIEIYLTPSVNKRIVQITKSKAHVYFEYDLYKTAIEELGEIPKVKNPDEIIAILQKVVRNANAQWICFNALKVLEKFAEPKLLIKSSFDAIKKHTDYRFLESVLKDLRKYKNELVNEKEIVPILSFVIKNATMKNVITYSFNILIDIEKELDVLPIAFELFNESKRNDVKSEILYVIGRIGPKAKTFDSLVPSLKKIVYKEQAMSLRNEAVRAITKISTIDEVIDFFIETEKVSDNETVNKTIISEMVNYVLKTGDKEDVVHILRDYIRKAPKSDSRTAAVEGLGRIKDM